MKFQSFLKKQKVASSESNFDMDRNYAQKNFPESINEEFEQFLTEGVHDKAIFKAVFLGGGPGSGKDYVLSRTLSGHGLTEINSDKAFEYLMDKNNLDMKMPESEKEARNLIRTKAKSTTELKEKLALMGRNGVIINGTGDNPEKIKRIKDRLEQLGYETSMIMVNASDEVSKQRNIERGNRGGRTVPEDIRKEKWNAVQKSKKELAKIFGDNYKEFDNSADLRTAPKEVVDEKEQEILQVFKDVQKFVSKPAKHDNAQKWISSELQKKDTYPIMSPKKVAPHPESSAAIDAKRMGLEYYGFGRYGKDKKVTFRAIHDKLTPVKKLQENVEPLLNESVTVSFTADSVDELNQVFAKMFGNTNNRQKEEYSLSSDDAMNVLTLGKKTNISEIRTDGVTFSNSDIDEILEGKGEENVIKDKEGNVRIFKVRHLAAKEAHQNNGVVHPHRKGGYYIKLKGEKKNVPMAKESIHETDERRDPSFLCESRTNQNSGHKTTLKEIREKQKAKIEESIDKGIEPGLSMAGAGESPARDMGEKWNKKKKVSVVETLGGAEAVINSISDKKEDELKKQGINLQTFKSKRPI